MKTAEKSFERKILIKTVEPEAKYNTLQIVLFLLHTPVSILKLPLTDHHAEVPPSPMGFS